MVQKVDLLMCTYAQETTWAEQAKLTAGDGMAGDEFGFSVAIAGDNNCGGGLA